MIRYCKKRDLILAAALLFSAAVLFLFLRFSPHSAAQTAQVTVDGILIQSIDLTENGVYAINSKNGGLNQLVVEQGQIWCSQASCPDKVCIQQGKKHLETDTIVCLPNQMIVTITGEKQ